MGIVSTCFVNNAWALHVRLVRLQERLVQKKYRTEDFFFWKHFDRNVKRSKWKLFFDGCYHKTSPRQFYLLDCKFFSFSVHSPTHSGAVFILWFSHPPPSLPHGRSLRQQERGKANTTHTHTGRCVRHFTLVPRTTWREGNTGESASGVQKRIQRV